jgi:prophage DNA circulation protein
MDEAFAVLLDLARRLIVDKEDLARVAGFAAVMSASAALDLARLVGEASDPVAFVDSARTTPVDGVPARYCLAVAGCFAAVRGDYAARQDAIAARTRLSADADALYPLLDDAGGDAVDFLVRLIGATVRALSDIAATRAPLVRVETKISLPSTLLAFDLYQAPERAAELVDRNRSATPFIMPSALEAVAS